MFVASHGRSMNLRFLWICSSLKWILGDWGMDLIDLWALYGNHLGRECHLPQQTPRLIDWCIWRKHAQEKAVWLQLGETVTSEHKLTPSLPWVCKLTLCLVTLDPQQLIFIDYAIRARQCSKHISWPFTKTRWAGHCDVLILYIWKLRLSLLQGSM